MADNELEQQEEKDVLMEDVAEADENELLGTEEKNANEQDEAMKEVDGDAEVRNDAAAEEQKKEEEVKKEEEDLDDGGAASDLEFSTEDERAGIVEETPSWTWHLEVYPIAPEDTQLDNFCKMIQTAVQSHIVYRSNELGEKRGEAHFYTHEAAAAKTLMRTICCRKFACIRPYIYLYRKKEGESEEYETAALRLDLIEAAKMRWDRQRKKQGEASSRVAKVSNVPLGTSQEFLNVLFARAFRVKRESAESEAEEARKAQEAAEKVPEKEAESSTSAEKKEGKDEKEEDEDKEDNEEEEEEELVGEFNGTVTVDCCSRTSLKGFLLGYRKIVIGENILTIHPLAPEEFDLDAMRREVRKKRAYELKHGKEWTPVTPADKIAFKEEDNRASGSRGGGYGGGSFGNRGGQGRGGDRGDRGRGGRGDSRGGRGGRGGVMTGRQKMNEKSMRRGGGRGGGGGGGGGGSFRDEMRYLQRDLALSTFELQRQLATLRGRDRGYGSGYGDPYLDPYLEPLGGRYGGGYRRDDWGGGYGGGRGGRGGGGGGGGGNKRPYRGKR